MNRQQRLILVSSLLSIACCLLSATSIFAQKKPAYVSGKLLDENENPLSNVSVVILGQQRGIVTADSGTFRLKVTADRAFAIVFSYTGFRSQQKNFLLNESEEETIVIRLEREGKTLEEVIVTDQRDRREAGLIKPNPKSVINLPSPVMGVESMIKVFVGSNNELTSQYNVRGGNYDENLVYVNDFEIYRPLLIHSGNQEGLTLPNFDLIRDLSFSSGGFEAKYGDKMSSVLDVRYKLPDTMRASFSISFLGASGHLEGSVPLGKDSYRKW